MRYRLEGKLTSEALGWASDGWTEAKAIENLADVKRRIREGKDARTLAEQRAASETKRKAEETLLPKLVKARNKIREMEEKGILTL